MFWGVCVCVRVRMHMKAHVRVFLCEPWCSTSCPGLSSATTFRAGQVLATGQASPHYLPSAKQHYKAEQASVRLTLHIQARAHPLLRCAGWQAKHTASPSLGLSRARTVFVQSLVVRSIPIEYCLRESKLFDQIKR